MPERIQPTAWGDLAGYQSYAEDQGGGETRKTSTDTDTDTDTVSDAEPSVTVTPIAYAPTPARADRCYRNR